MLSPPLLQEQLSDPPGPIFIRIGRRVDLASMRVMQALESEKDHSKSRVQVCRSWKAPVGAVMGIYPSSYSENKISNLIPGYIIAKISKLFYLSNYLLSCCRVRSTLFLKDVHVM